jgi:hypothetical protein
MKLFFSLLNVHHNKIGDFLMLITTCFIFIEPKLSRSFNATTTITFELPKTAEIELVVIDLLGRCVRTFEKKILYIGIHSITAREGTTQVII